MKKLIFTTVFAFLFAAGSVVPAQNPQQEYLGLPGDNLNLFAVMNLFQESKTLEAFERSINDPEAMINNLDLNGDGYVDYIMVHDYQDGNIHNIVLRVALFKDEYQDVAVFVVEKLRDGSVRIQLIGDKALYGPNYIIEPNYAERANPGYQGTAARTHSATVVHTNYYEVAQWPVVVYMYRPVYRPWRSAWYYGYHPAWWSPWSPHYYHYYYGYHYHWHGHYHAYYRPSRHVRSVHYHTVYVTNHRNTSPTVVTRVEQGRYRNTYSNPEKVQEGQQLFAQRHPGRYEQVATKSNNIAAPELRQSPSSIQDVKQSPAREAGTPGTAAERRQEDAVRQSTERQSSEDVRRQSPAVTPSRDNRSIQQDDSRQQTQPVRSQGTESSPRQQAQPTRGQESEASPRRENNSPAVRPTPPPARQSSPPPQREVERPAPQRNTSTPPSSPPRVNQNNRPSSPAVSSPPARSTQQPSSNVRPSGSNNRSTPAPSRSSNNKRSGSSNENKNSSERRR